MSDVLSPADFLGASQASPSNVIDPNAFVGVTPQPAPTPFNVLPLNKDAQGNIHFDPNAGVLGSMIQAFKAPGDVWQGNLDPRSPEANQRALTLATMAMPINPAVRAGDLAIPGVMRNFQKAKPNVPTAAALNSAADAGYDAARATGASYPGDAVSAFAKDTVNGLNNDGILANLAPQTHSILDQLSNPPEGATANIAGLDAARRALNRIRGNFINPTDQEAARRGVDAIDKFIQARGEAPPMAGTPASPGASALDGAGAIGASEAPTAEAQAAQLIKDARGNAAAAFRSNRITDAEDAAELRAAAANSGKNVGNAIRQRLASILTDPKKSAGYSQDELAAIEQVVRGTATSNTLRKVGNMLGGGGGLGQTFIGGLGALVGGHFGGLHGAEAGAVALPMAGAAARSGYNSLVGHQLSAAEQLIRMRSPLYQQMLQNAPYAAAGPGWQSPLMRGTAMSLLNPPQEPTGPLAP